MIDQIVCPYSSQFPRNSEADVVELADGRLFLAWTEFYGGYGDHAAAHISAMASTDGGLTWGPKSLLQENVGGKNVMSVSLLRMHSGELLLFYLVKNALSDCEVWMRRSGDETASWSDASPVSTRPGYHVMNNARVIQLQDGRLLAPVALYPDVESGPPSRAFCYVSDDDGASWRPGRGDVGLTGSPAQEPGLVELADGSVLMIIRTKLGWAYTARSIDGGESWSCPIASPLVSPSSPAAIARIPKTDSLMVVWNPNPLGAKARWQDRTPLTSAVSHDGGYTWVSQKDLEDSSDYCYAYPSITFVQQDVLLTYYQWARMKGARAFENTSLKLRRVPIEWVLA